MSDTLQRIAQQVLRALAQVVGGLLAVFGGGCVVMATLSGMMLEGVSAILWVILFGVLPLIAGIALFRWGKGEWGKPLDLGFRRRRDGPPGEG
jgi:hypothetical protein